VDRLVEEEMQKQHIPGAAVAVLRDGRPVKARGYGLASIELNAPATAESVFKIGSISKQFIAAGVLVLLGEGKVALDDSIAKYLEDAPEAWKPITLRQLLSHTSGILREGPAFEFLRTKPDIGVIRSAYARPLEFAPGEKWQYCNVCYFALAEVITRVSGTAWPAFLEERIFRPLGMTATRATSTFDIVSHRVRGYDWRDGVYRNSDLQVAVRPSGALLSNVLDLAKWDGALYTERPLAGAIKEQMWSPIRLNSGGTHNYGFGWETGVFQGRRYVGHGGSLAGFRSHYMRFPDSKLSVIVLTNLDGARPNVITQRVAGQYLEEAGR
jgi:CubicO group peptidase (beta-lactamase class C family)